LSFDKADIYIRSDAFGEFWQGEILSGIVEVQWKGPAPNDVVLVNHPLSIVCSADCDLTQDYDTRSTGSPTFERLLTNLLCCDIEPADAFRDRRKTTGVNSQIWTNVTKNKHERYHFFSDVNNSRDLQAQGFPTLVADFKLSFCVSMLHLLSQFEQNGNAKRRCRLSPPFAQHFAQRFFYYQSRIGLPVEHDSPGVPPAG
jgi:hypothetical protein